MAEMDDQELLRFAVTARERAYAPYSQFKVGAALLCASGKVFLGCNVENSAYPATICAERGAVAAAVAAGEHDFVRLAVVAGSPGPVSPCGMCRQVLVEFAPALPVVSVARDGTAHHWVVSELLPHPFVPASLAAG